MSKKFNILVIPDFQESAIQQIQSVAPDVINVVPVSSIFYEEILRDWDENIVNRFLKPPRENASPLKESKDELLRTADAIFMSWPFPKTLPQRAPNLRWMHFPFAGVSNLHNTACWGVPITVTSSRGYTLALPIAETVLAAIFAFSKRLDIHMQRQMNGEMANPRLLSIPKMRVVNGKTIGIVGLGGIGKEVAKLAKGAGMRVLATKRSVEERIANIEEVDELFPRSQLKEMLSVCDFVAVCTALTSETEGMIGTEAISAMKNDAYLINIARGEIIDENAMIAALHSGKLGGSFVDVWAEEFIKPPNPDLLSAPNLTFMPHTSGRGDANHAFALNLFCSNLQHFINDEPLENIVDWERGY